MDISFIANVPEGKYLRVLLEEPSTDTRVVAFFCNGEQVKVILEEGSLVKMDILDDTHP